MYFVMFFLRAHGDGDGISLTGMLGPEYVRTPVQHITGYRFVSTQVQRITEYYSIA